MISPKSIQGWMSDGELDWLTNTIYDLQPRLSIEVGIWKGRSTSAICNALIQVGFGKLIAIDNWTISAIDPINYKELETGREKVIAEAHSNLAGYVRIGMLDILGMSSDVAFQILLKDILPFYNTNVSFIFIDGDHDGFQVERDINNYRQLLAPGGTIAGHDIQLVQVCSAVEKFIGKDYQTFETIWYKKL